MSAGDSHTCGLTDAGAAYCWGSNRFGNLGDGTTTQRLLPVVVKNAANTGPLTGVTQITTGHYSSFALLSDGTVRAMFAVSPAPAARTTERRSWPS